MLAPAVGGEDDAAAVDLAHIVDEGGGVGKVVEGHFEERGHLARGEAKGVGPLPQPADEGAHAEVADRPDLVDLAQQIDILGRDADLLVGLAQGGEGGAVVTVVAGATREADLALVVLDLVGTFLEEQVDAVVAFVEEEQHGGGLCLATVAAPGFVAGERVPQLLPERGLGAILKRHALTRGAWSTRPGGLSTPGQRAVRGRPWSRARRRRGGGRLGWRHRGRGRAP